MTQSRTRNAGARRRAADLAAHADRLSSRLLEVTTCLYKPDSQGYPNAVGSGVLLAIGDARFLVSAAHVLDEQKEHLLYLPTGDALVPIAGEFTRVYSTTASGPADDHVDLGIARLAPRLAEQVPVARFAQWHEIDHSRRTLAGHAFGLLGYPLTKQRSPVEGGYIVARAYRMAGMECASTIYAAERQDPRVSILLGFDRRRMWSPEGQVSAPDLYGVSGGGIWRFGRRLREATSPPRLAGIVIEWHRSGKHKYVLATRIELVMAALTQRYPDVRHAVEALLDVRPN